ncbi:MAG TPA: SIS domain-containing protein [Streptosporangiaceae bacterium]|nr:SIS domain-containing protein [Streptosporangiaceae bacterium]
MTAAAGAELAVRAAFQRRVAPTAELSDHAAVIVGTAHAMAMRFRAGGKLVVFGTGGTSTDAQHVAVEFVHPVIVGKRALPAISLAADAATVTAVAVREGMAGIFAHQIRYLAEPADIALGISADGNCSSVLSGLLAASDAGMLTVALAGGSGGAIGAAPVIDHLLTAGCADPRVVKEMHVTIYHLLWELVHVFLDQPAAPGTECSAGPGSPA